MTQFYKNPNLVKYCNKKKFKQNKRGQKAYKYKWKRNLRERERERERERLTGIVDRFNTF